MAFELDYETSEIEGISIKTTEERSKLFFKNYRHFGWKFVLKTAVPVYNTDDGKFETGSIYRFTFERSKNLVSYDELCRLEQRFQDLTGEIDFRKEGLVFAGDKVLPDYIDYKSDAPILAPYKISVFTAVFNTVMCFALIGFLMWIDTLNKLKKNKKAKRYAEIKEEVREIFRNADALE